MGYQVGNLDVTICGVSKDAVSSINEVIERLNRLQSILPAVASGFSYAFSGINSSAFGGLGDFATEAETAARNVSRLNGEVWDTSSAAASGARQLNNLADAENNADKGARKAQSGLSKLTKHIGGIALYRTIRRGLQMITRTFTESVQSYAMVDDNINKTMSQLTSSTKVIKLSLGTMLLPIIQAITPAVQSLSVGFANMANAINKTMALMQGNTTYTKIDAEAYENYRKQIEKTSGALFDFDKFRALSSKKDSLSASSFLVTETVSELTDAEKKYSGIYTLVSGIGDALNTAFEAIEKIANSSAIQTISTIVGGTVSGLSSAASWLLDILDTTGLLEPFLGGIAGYLTFMGASKLFIALGGGSLVKWIGAVVDLLKYDASGTLKMLAGDLTKVMSSTKMLAISIGALTTSIGYLVQNWDDMSTTARTLTITLSAVAAAVVGIFTGLVALKWAGLGVGAAIKAGISAAALTGAIGLAIGTAASTAKNSIPKYAMGASDIDSGSLFIAGEAGKTEMVYTGDNGKTNVANVQQMGQAVYIGTLQALKDFGVARSADIPQLREATDTGIYQAAERGARKVGKTFKNV